MAERRMLSKSIIDNDTFLDLPQTAQNLYFHLLMRADDDGFISNPKSIMRIIGARDDDLKVLIVKNFLIPFDSGVVVIKHWRIHNYIQKDRYKQTLHKEELSSLSLDENKAYIDKNIDVSKMYPECIQTVSKMDTQVSIGKDIDSIGNSLSSIDSIEVNISDLPFGEKEEENIQNNEQEHIQTAYSKLVSYFEKEKNAPVTSTEMHILHEFTQLYSIEFIQEAFKVAIENNTRKLSYVRAILQDWEGKGFKRVEEIREYRNSFGKSKKHLQKKQMREPNYTKPDENCSEEDRLKVLEELEKQIGSG